MHWWAGPQSDLMSAPSPPLGPQSDWCVPYLPPLPGAGLTVEWCGPSGLLAHCQACGAASMGSGQGRISSGGSATCTGLGGAGLASFALSGLLWEGPCSTGREADLLEGSIHRSTALGGCTVQASSVTGTGSLWNFGWGMGEGNGACQHQALSFQGSTTLPPGILLPSLLSESRPIDF